MARITVTRGALAGLALALWPLSAGADLAEAVEDVITPAYARLADRGAALARAAWEDCSPEALHAPFAALWDEWAYIDFLRLGPVEEDGRALAMSYWPDAKASGRRAQQALLQGGDLAILTDPARFADLSVALRGLAGLERLIYPSKLTGAPDALCAMRRATADDLARMTGEIRDDWPAYAALLLTPGSPGNSTYLSTDEARQALFTQVITGLESLATTRLGRPLGSFDRPRPDRAEAIASGRSLRNVTRDLEGLRDLALALHPDAPVTQAAFARALKLAAELDDPVFAGVGDPQGRLRVEILQQAVTAARDAVMGEAGVALGLSVGFNSRDGD